MLKAASLGLPIEIAWFPLVIMTALIVVCGGIALNMFQMGVKDVRLKDQLQGNRHLVKKGQSTLVNIQIHYNADERLTYTLTSRLRQNFALFLVSF